MSPLYFRRMKTTSAIPTSAIIKSGDVKRDPDAAPVKPVVGLVSPPAMYFPGSPDDAGLEPCEIPMGAEIEGVAEIPPWSPLR